MIGHVAALRGIVSASALRQVQNIRPAAGEARRADLGGHALAPGGLLPSNALISRNSSSPNTPPSRPLPECL